MVGLFEAGGMEGGGDSLSGLIPIVTSSWSISAVIVRIWNQHTYRTHTVSDVYGKNNGQWGTYRHNNINEWKVRVSKPPRDLDRIIQRLSTPSPIH